MPHKRNPVSSAVLIAAATRAPGLVSTLFAAMPQEHERSLGLWHAEWETLPELCCLVAGALQQAIGLLEGLEVDAQRMRRNLGLTHGLVLAEAVSIALARRIGREAAHHLVEQCCRRAVEQRRELRAVLGEEARVSAELSGDELDRLLDPAHYLGQASRLGRARARRTPCPGLRTPSRLTGDPFVPTVRLADGDLNYSFEATGRRAGPAVVKLAGHRPGHVGHADPRTHRPFPRVALRHLRPRRLAGHPGPYAIGQLRRRRACPALMPSSCRACISAGCPWAA